MELIFSILPKRVRTVSINSLPRRVSFRVSADALHSTLHTYGSFVQTKSDWFVLRIIEVEKIDLVLLFTLYSHFERARLWCLPRRTFFGTVERKGVSRYCIAFDSANKTSRLVPYMWKHVNKETSRRLLGFICESQHQFAHRFNVDF